MTEIEKQILAALQQLDAAVAGLKAGGPKADVGARLATLDALAEQLPPNTNPQLRHYLRNKSYEKARLLLEGRDAENARGRC
jgi:hypothetical protein